MKLKVKIHEVAKSRGIKNPYQLQKLAELSPSNAVNLYTNNIVQISVETLSTLCTVLNCTPNDLFVGVKPASKRRAKG
ncbi:MAG: Cro/C1-type DNA-binding domain [Acidobacteriota bacterium]|nr:Cro/C1-type DNA-binding domain [Acidobacteriota bacterium]